MMRDLNSITKKGIRIGGYKLSFTAVVPIFYSNINMLPVRSQNREIGLLLIHTQKSLHKHRIKR